MLSDLSVAAQAERRKDLLTTAAQYRLAAEAAPPAALRRRLGRTLVALGAGLAGDPDLDVRLEALRIGEEAGQWSSC
jgi:hypothetical protein